MSVESTQDEQRPAVAVHRLVRNRFFRLSGTCWQCDTFHPEKLLVQIVNDEVRYVHWKGRHVWTGRTARDAMRVLRVFFPDDFANSDSTKPIE